MGPVSLQSLTRPASTLPPIARDARQPHGLVRRSANHFCAPQSRPSHNEPVLSGRSSTADFGWPTRCRGAFWGWNVEARQLQRAPQPASPPANRLETGILPVLPALGASRPMGAATRRRLLQPRLTPRPPAAARARFREQESAKAVALEQQNAEFVRLRGNQPLSREFALSE